MVGFRLRGRVSSGFAMSKSKLTIAVRLSNGLSCIANSPPQPAASFLAAPLTIPRTVPLAVALRVPLITTPLTAPSFNQLSRVGRQMSRTQPSDQSLVSVSTLESVATTRSHLHSRLSLRPDSQSSSSEPVPSSLSYQAGSVFTIRSASRLRNWKDQTWDFLCEWRVLSRVTVACVFFLFARGGSRLVRRQGGD